MIIYEATPDQAYGVAKFMKSFEAETSHVLVDPEYAGRKYAEMITNGNGHMFVMEENGEMIGGLGCVVGDDLHYPRKIAIETYWFMHPDHRGYGIKLLRHFEAWAKEHGCGYTAMVHLVDSMPDSLEALYARRGYTLIEKHYLKAV